MVKNQVTRACNISTIVYRVRDLTRISDICNLGFVGLSSHTSFVSGPIADETSSKSLVFTRLQVLSLAILIQEVEPG